MVDSLFTVVIGHWGYGAIFLVVILSGIGVPVPEETILTLAGYLVWRNDLSLGPVLLVGVLAACLGDNMGYWVGRHLGSAALSRLAARLWISPETLAATQRLVLAHGGLAIFVARFVPGLRFAAGPVAGIAGVSAPTFFAANVLGAVCYVPAAVGLGYAVGHGVGSRVEALRTAGVAIEHVVLAAAVVATISAFGLRARRARAAGR